MESSGHGWCGLRFVQRWRFSRCESIEWNIISDSSRTAIEKWSPKLEIVEEKVRIPSRDREKRKKNKFSLGQYEGKIYHLTEWRILVHVIQGRDVPDGDVNSYACIQINDQKRYTGVQKSSHASFSGEVNLSSPTLRKDLYRFFNFFPLIWSFPRHKWWRKWSISKFIIRQRSSVNLPIRNRSESSKLVWPPFTPQRIIHLNANRHSWSIPKRSKSALVVSFFP